MAEMTPLIEVLNDPGIREALSKIPCPDCGKCNLQMEMHQGPIKVKNVGEFSLAGQQMKFSATFDAEAFLVCPDCGYSKKGKK